jgi:predicted phosphodiesterase
MRLLVLSDLHLDAWDRVPLTMDLAASRPDVIVLAGDIHIGTAAVAWAEQAFRDLPVLYIPGNHEAYCDRIDEVEARLARACDRSATVTWLQERACILRGVRFLGCTLWTDFALFGEEHRDERMQDASRRSDYRLIRLAREGGRTLQPADTLTMHRRQRAWLEVSLATPFDAPTVVVTHMAPSMRSVPLRYRADPFSAMYASRLDDLVAMADLWIHGHTHDGFNYNVGGCRVVCNPRGYPSRTGQPENTRFDPNLIIEVGPSSER